MKEPKDKRTKEYKKWKQKQGLGDNIEKVLNSKPIKPITKAIKKAIWKDDKDCGCNERKEKLNNLFTKRRKPVRCLTRQQFDQYHLYTKTRTLNIWNEAEIHFLIKLYAHVFAIKYNHNDLCRSCAGSGKLLFRISSELDRVYETYKRDLQDLKIK